MKQASFLFFGSKTKIIIPALRTAVNAAAINIESQNNSGIPNAPRRAHLQAHKADTQKPTLQKSLPCANASKRHTPHLLDTVCQATHPTEGRTHNRGLAAIAGRRINHQ